jgi:hypothetical protein
VSDSSLARHAGPIALGAGGAFAAVDLVLFALMEPDDRIGMMANPVFMVFNAAYFFAFVGLTIGLIALHGRQADQAGRFGLVAFLTALVGTMMQGGNMWFDGFAAPWLAEVAPQVFTAEKTPILVTGALLSYLLFALGWVLFGLASLRARSFPVVFSIAVMLAGVIGFQSGLPPYGVPIGLAVAALGAWSIRSDRTAQRLEDFPRA